MKKNFLKLDEETRQKTKKTTWAIAIISLVVSISIVIGMFNNETPQSDKPLIIVFIVFFIIAALFCGILAILLTIWDKGNVTRARNIETKELIETKESKINIESNFNDNDQVCNPNPDMPVLEEEYTEQRLAKLQAKVNAKENDLWRYSGEDREQLKEELDKDKKKLFVIRKMIDLKNLNDIYNVKGNTSEEIYYELKEKKANDKEIKKYLGLKIYSEDTSKTFKACNDQANDIITNIQYQEFIKENSKYLKKLSTNVNTMQSNEKLVKIATNFVKANKLRNLEILATPTEYFKGEYMPIYDLDTLTECKYDNMAFTLIAGFNSFKTNHGFFENIQDEMIEQEETMNAYNHSEYDNPLYLYKMLIKQGLLTNNESNRDAFLIFLSEIARNYKEETFINLKEKYKIENETNDEIIEKLYKLGYGIPEIIQFVSLKKYLDSGNAPYESIEEEMTEEVETKVGDLREKKYLDSLLSDQVKTKKNIADIDLMSGLEFEKFIADMFSDMGYRTERTKGSGDQGVDVIAIKNDTVIAIQAKCYSGVVGNHAIMEAVGGMKFYNANKCMVITNSTFTKSAIELAKVNNVELWDREVLKEKIS